MTTKPSAPDERSPQTPERHWRLRTPAQAIVHGVAIALGAGGGIAGRLTDHLRVIEPAVGIAVTYAAPAIVGGLAAWLLPDPHIRRALPHAATGTIAFSIAFGLTHIDLLAMGLVLAPLLALVTVLSIVAFWLVLAALTATTVCLTRSVISRRLRT